MDFTWDGSMREAHQTPKVWDALDTKMLVWATVKLQGKMEVLNIWHIHMFV
ncbi:putative YD-repeat toxin [Salmonella phage 18-India]|nr:putative YD-repeat toxin [Salmonella phage 18-India]